jgi:hypothetical protein
MTISASFGGVMVNNPVPNILNFSSWHQVLFLGKGWTGGFTPSTGFTIRIDIAFPTTALPTKLTGSIDISGGPGISFNIIASVDKSGNIIGKLTGSSTWNGQKISGSVTGSFTIAGNITITSSDALTLNPAHLLQPIAGTVALTTKETGVGGKRKAPAPKRRAGDHTPKKQVAKNPKHKKENPEHPKHKKPRRKKAPKKKKIDE